MFKFIKKSSFILTFLVGSFAVNAGLLTGDYTITKFTDSNIDTLDYISVKHDDGSSWVDWAWASSVSVQYDGFFNLDGNGELQFDIDGNPILDDPDNDEYNELFSPEHVEGWRVATFDEFAFFQSFINLADFKDESNNYITATRFWNSIYINVEDISIDAFGSTNYKTSSRVEGTFSDDDNIGTSTYDTFYVRTHSSDSTPIPEPSTLMIFALGLIAFASKKKALLKSTK